MTETGRRLGRYRLEELLGQGGMAEVWRARDERLGRTVAVKVILTAHARDAHFRERFQKEAQLVASHDGGFRGFRCLLCARLIHRHDGVQRRIDGCDALQAAIEKLDRG